MTQNHLELAGLETHLRELIGKLNMATREGTLLAVADALSDIEHTALMAGFTVNEILRANRK